MTRRDWLETNCFCRCAGKKNFLLNLAPCKKSKMYLSRPPFLQTNKLHLGQLRLHRFSHGCACTHLMPWFAITKMHSRALLQRRAMPFGRTCQMPVLRPDISFIMQFVSFVPTETVCHTQLLLAVIYNVMHTTLREVNLCMRGLQPMHRNLHMDNFYFPLFHLVWSNIVTINN